MQRRTTRSQPRGAVSRLRSLGRRAALHREELLGHRVRERWLFEIGHRLQRLRPRQRGRHG